jgi:hypothetical protein
MPEYFDLKGIETAETVSTPVEEFEDSLKRSLSVLDLKKLKKAKNINEFLEQLKKYYSGEATGSGDQWTGNEGLKQGLMWALSRSKVWTPVVRPRASTRIQEVRERLKELRAVSTDAELKERRQLDAELNRLISGYDVGEQTLLASAKQLQLVKPLNYAQTVEFIKQSEALAEQGLLPYYSRSRDAWRGATQAQIEAWTATRTVPREAYSRVLQVLARTDKITYDDLKASAGLPTGYGDVLLKRLQKTGYLRAGAKNAEGKREWLVKKKPRLKK